MNNLKIMKKGVGPKKIFLVLTTDLDSTAKKNDRSRHLFFDPTCVTRDTLSRALPYSDNPEKF